MFMSEAQEFCPLKSCCPKMESFDISFPTKTPHIYDMYMYIYIYIYLQFSEIFSYLYCLEFQEFLALLWILRHWFGFPQSIMVYKDWGLGGRLSNHVFLMGFLASWLSSSFFIWVISHILLYFERIKNQPGYFWKKGEQKLCISYRFCSSCAWFTGLPNNFIQTNWFLLRSRWLFIPFQTADETWNVSCWMLIQSDSGKIYDWVGTRRLLVPRVAREKKTRMEPSWIWLRTLSLWATGIWSGIDSQ